MMKLGNMLMVDIESNGLYGEIFCVGAVYYNRSNQSYIPFYALADDVAVTEPWVIENVLPQLEGAPRFKTSLEMRNAFWEFYMKHKDNASIWADFGAPLEARFFSQCISDDLASRQWLGPYPLHEVGTALLMLGEDPDMDRSKFMEGTDYRRHNPVSDCMASVQCLLTTEKFSKATFQVATIESIERMTTVDNMKTIEQITIDAMETTQRKFQTLLQKLRGF